MHYPSPAGQHAIATLAEGALQEQARMLSTLLGNLEGMVYRCRDDAHWTMEFVSEGCLRMTGYRPEDLLFNHRISYEEVTHPEDRARVRREIHRALRQDRRFDLEYRIVRADGAVRWVWGRGTGVRDSQGGLLAIEGIVQDVTERKQAEQAVAEAERRYRGIFENALEGIFQTTLDGHYLAVNPALARIYGYDSAEEMMASLSDIQHQLYVEPRWRQEFLRLMQRDGVVAHFESRVYRKSGEIIWISENARAVRDEGGALLFFEGMVEDITDRKRYQARLEYQAGHDALTGLPNRSLLCERLDQAIRHARTQDSLLAVAFVDLDQFKLINDSLGHHAGDEYLKLVAARLSSCLREHDTIARQGGDEFVILLAGQNRPEDIEHTVQRLLSTIAQPWHYGDIEFHGSCSIGVSLYPKDGADAESLLKSADSAMYQAKQAGRNAVRFFTPELSAQLMQRLEMESRLRAALERQEFLLHYQPRVCLKSGALLGAEALLRWQSPDEGLVLPGRFIALAEETGLIVPIGEWVLQAACAQAAAWRKLWPGAHLVFSVNLSPRQFRDQPLCAQVRAALESAALPPAMLELELTENLVMHDAEGFVSVLREVKSLGVKVAIDDFGTGYSSLSYLKKFPVDRLKVDQSFVRGLGGDAEDASIVRAIIGLGHSLELAVVAEGVETGEQLEFLRRHGCDEGQGYYFSHPLPAEAFEALLQRQAADAAGRWPVPPWK